MTAGTVLGMRAAREPIDVLEPGSVDYRTAWDQQRAIAAARIADTGPDTLILLEHPSVYTAGRRTQPTDLPRDGSPVIEVDRGGRITWHGPGQLVAYPIVLLAERMNLTGYVRLLEQALIATCADFDVDTMRVAGRSGVWLPAAGGRPERKIAAIGVHVARGVTSHGVALNCNPDLTAFDRIVPCGISDAGVTSLSAELGTEITVHDALPRLRHWMCEALDGRLPIRKEAVRAVLAEPSGGPASDNGVSWELAPSLLGG